MNWLDWLHNLASRVLAYLTNPDRHLDKACDLYHPFGD